MTRKDNLYKHDSRSSKKFYYLMLALLLMLLAAPVSIGGEIGEWVFSLLSLAVVVFAAYATRKSYHMPIVATVLALLAISIDLTSLVNNNHFVELMDGVFYVFFFVLVTIAIFRDAMTERQITTDTIYGAICVYFFIGITFGMVYEFLELIQPGSFASNSGTAWFDLHYYSFITLTTIGYGEITPVSRYARSLVLVEGVLGVFYLMPRLLSPAS